MRKKTAVIIFLTLLAVTHSLLNLWQYEINGRRLHEPPAPVFQTESEYSQGLTIEELEAKRRKLESTFEQERKSNDIDSYWLIEDVIMVIQFLLFGGLSIFAKKNERLELALFAVLMILICSMLEDYGFILTYSFLILCLVIVGGIKKPLESRGS